MESGMSLGSWEIIEYAGTAVVIVAVIGEYIADFGVFGIPKNEYFNKQLAKLSTLVLIAGLAVEMTGLIRTSQLFELEIAKQQERAANAEKELLELQNRLARRVMTEEQSRRISESLQQFRGQTLSLAIAGQTEEINNFGNQLITALENGGLKVSASNAIISGMAASGITAAVGENRLPLINAIANALRSAGVIDAPLPVTKSGNKDELTIFVWPKKQ